MTVGDDLRPFGEPDESADIVTGRALEEPVERQVACSRNVSVPRVAGCGGDAFVLRTRSHVDDGKSFLAEATPELVEHHVRHCARNSSRTSSNLSG